MPEQKQTGKLIARIAENLPQMSGDIMQGWIDNPMGLQEFLGGLVLTAGKARRDFDAFFRTRPGLWVDSNFRSWVVAKATTPTAGRVARKSTKLERNMADVEIEKMLGVGDGHIFDESQTCDIVMEMIAKQEGGREGELLNNGYANIFYLGSCVVFVYWYVDHRKWSVHTYVRSDNRWYAGGQVFFPATAA